MSFSSLRNLALGLSTMLLAAACTSSADEGSRTTTGEVAADNQDSAHQNMKEGWKDVKNGTKEIATGVGQKARETGREVSAEVKEVGTELKASACPVIGNRSTKRYYTQSDKDYPTMLKGEKILSADNRECFMSERAAMDDGYSKAR